MKTIEYDPNSYNTALDELVTALRAGDEVTVVPVDPYEEYRRAQDEGKIVQYQLASGRWVDRPKSTERWDFCCPPDRYRIKSDTVKMWQWVIRTEPGTVRPTTYFYTDETAVRKVLRETTVILQRADWTEISVKVEQ